MTPHQEAWDYVQQEIFGRVCEVTREVPWGFKKDRPDIENKTVEAFLETNESYDTIILHILSGEGEKPSKIIEVLESAYERAVKVIVLEHNPEHSDWSHQSLGRLFIEEWLSLRNEVFNKKEWGRNLLFSFTTLSPLHLPQLNDEYLKRNLGVKYVSEHDCGIDKNYLVYTHTSEYSIDFTLPSGRIYWVIGGGLPYESMTLWNENILFDSVLLQVLHCAYQYGVNVDKLKRLFKDIELIGKDSPDSLPHWNNRPNLWRKVKINGVIPQSIIHLDIKKLKCEDDTVYVSTVDKQAWSHLEDQNNIIDAWTKRDTPVLIINETVNDL